jgi:hypothetical protein
MLLPASRRGSKKLQERALQVIPVTHDEGKFVGLRLLAVARSVSFGRS